MLVCIGDHLQLCGGWPVAIQLCTAPLCSNTYVGQVPQYSTPGSAAVSTPNEDSFTVCRNE